MNVGVWKCGFLVPGLFRRFANPLTLGTNFGRV